MTKMKVTIAVVLIMFFPLIAFAGGEKETAAAAGDGPKYGGTLTLASTQGDPTTADFHQQQWPTAIYAPPVLDYLLTGDVDKYGPRGTNQFTFRAVLRVPPEFTGGGVTESWELSTDGSKITFHIRPGVYWAAIGKEHVMESREFTAYDAEFTTKRFYEHCTWLHDLCPVDSMYAVDKYTFVIEMPTFTSVWPSRLGAGWANTLYAPEVVEAGAHDWNNLVGTGPWMVKEYIPGSAMIYEKNPLYWDTTVIDGKEYEIPFLDEMIYTIISDESTRISALRTGKLDMVGGFETSVPLRYQDNLKSTAPDLILEEVLDTLGHYVEFFAFNEGLPPEITTDVNIRRALMIGLDLDAIAEAVFLRAEVHSWPASYLDQAVFTPFDELSASSQELFSFNTEKAKQLLADAGYPDGFKPTMVIDSASTLHLDIASMLKDQWAKIGVELDLRVMESGAMQEFTHTDAGEKPPFHLRLGRESSHAAEISIGGRIAGPRPGVPSYFDKRFKEGNQTVNSDARNAIYREICLRAIDEVIHIPIGTPYLLLAHWPWVKNWYGETEESAWSTAHTNARIWIDQDLKKEMGF